MTLTLILSDLHVAAGRNPDSGKFSPLDDFQADEILARFLAHYDEEEKGHLILNGDTFDLTQVIDLPTDPREIQQLIGQPQLDRDRRCYGLGHTPPELCWKLERVALGHPIFFSALGAWVQRGHHLHFVIGNHDVELRYPAVRQRLVELIAAAQPDLAPSAVQPHVHFHAWYFYQPDQHLYTEHGGQYEPLANTDGDKIPACYFNNRYLFNMLEIRTPEADNISPFSRYIAWLVSTDTLATLYILIRRLPAFLRARRRTHHRLPPADLPDPRFPPPVEEAMKKAAVEQHRRIQRLGYRTSLLTVLAILLNLVAHVSLLLTVGLAVSGHIAWAILSLAVWPLARLVSTSIITNRLHRSMVVENDFLQEAARHIAPFLAGHGVRTIVFGHTHQADLCRFEDSVQYFNTGTWIPLFSDDTRLDARNQAYLFVEVRDGRSRLLRWNDGARQPETPIIIDRNAASRRRKGCRS
ncbi:MAG: hypothetical protein JW900_00475 [Anaerolineae bacterium]|nr:hypothetical protein [Anaerolineae bacterium]